MTLSALESLTRLLEPWAARYGDSAVLATVVTAVHLAGMLVAGGLAIAADRATLRAGAGGGMADPARARLLEELSAAHRPVLAGLAVTAVSGLLLLAADLETYLASPVYWVKMGLVVLLLANGALLARTERALAMPELDAGAAAASWRRLRRSAHASRLLWLLILFAGVALVNVA